MAGTIPQEKVSIISLIIYDLLQTRLMSTIITIVYNLIMEIYFEGEFQKKSRKDKRNKEGSNTPPPLNYNN